PVSVRPRPKASSPFFTRFSIDWRRSVRSMAMGGTVWSVVASTVLPCRAATGRTNSTSAATISLTESSSYCGRGKRAKARYSSVMASSALTCSRMAVTSVAASSMSAPPPLLGESTPQLGVQLDGRDGIAHLVGHLEGQFAHRSHALGHYQLGLRALETGQRARELRVEPLHLGAGPPLAGGDHAHR